MTKQIYELVPHPAFAPWEVSGVSIRWTHLNDGRLMLRYRVDGAGSVVAPEFKGRGRGYDLWKNTCCELFLHDGDGMYREYNFSPSEQWAAYRFSGYRTNRRDIEPVSQPEIIAEQGHSIFMLTVFLSQAELIGSKYASLAMVVEEKKKRPSYWALAHNKYEPDFHDPSCFTLAVPSLSPA